LAELQAYRPFVIVNGSYHRSADAVGTGIEFAESGSFTLEFEQDVKVSLADDPEKVEQQFQEDIGAIIDEIGTLAGTAGYLAITGIEWDSDDVSRTPLADVEAIGDAISTTVTVTWGQEG
jgi:hypothetical protein